MKALKVGVLSIGVLFACVNVASAHVVNPGANATNSKNEQAKRLAAAAENLKNGTLCMERARKAAELGAQEVAVSEIVCVQKLAAETDRLAADGRLLGHEAYIYAGGDANAAAAPGFAAATALRGLAFEAQALLTKCCDVAFVNKAAYDSMKADFDKQNAAITKDVADAEKALKELETAAAKWEDVDEASRKKLAAVVKEILPSIKASLGLFDKFSKLAIATIDYTIDGSDEHYASLAKEGTTSKKVSEMLNADSGGADAKFTEDLDELGVPTMNKQFKITKANFEGLARVGERIINAALAVLKPATRTKVKDKTLENYKSLITAAKDKLMAVYNEVKGIQEKLGSGEIASGDGAVQAE